MTLKYAVWENQDLPDDEIEYWKGWLSFVDYLAAINFPTNAFFLEPVASKYDPPCSPIGAPDCTFNSLTTEQKKFIHILVQESDHPEKILDHYAMGIPFGAWQLWRAFAPKHLTR